MCPLQISGSRQDGPSLRFPFFPDAAGTASGVLYPFIILMLYQQ
jgi:hypothetical protein